MTNVKKSFEDIMDHRFTMLYDYEPYNVFNTVLGGVHNPISNALWIPEVIIHAELDEDFREMMLLARGINV